MEYGIVRELQIDARYREHAERMCVHAGAMLGLSFLPKVKWFVPVTPQNRGQFMEVFTREEGLLGLARPSEANMVLVARNQFLDDAMTTLAHEVFHLAQFGYAKNTGMPSDDHVELSADEFAAEAVATIDWNRHSDAALEWLVKLPAESPVSGDTGDDRQAHLKASLRRVGQQVKTYAERCVKTAQNPKASREEVEEAHRRVEAMGGKVRHIGESGWSGDLGGLPPLPKKNTLLAGGPVGWAFAHSADDFRMKGGPAVLSTLPEVKKRLVKRFSEHG